MWYSLKKSDQLRTSLAGWGCLWIKQNDHLYWIFVYFANNYWGPKCNWLEHWEKLSGPPLWCSISMFQMLRRISNCIYIWLAVIVFVVVYCLFAPRLFDVPSQCFKCSARIGWNVWNGRLGGFCSSLAPGGASSKRGTRVPATQTKGATVGARGATITTRAAGVTTKTEEATTTTTTGATR